MMASFVCRKTLQFEAGSIYAWETAEGNAGNILFNAEATVARPCTPEGVALGDMFLGMRVGNVENPDPDVERCHTFLVAAAAIFQEREREGRLPDEITRTYW